ncbi:hypothetical protein MRX96_025123 [Rhipicephalus microplus]
MHIESEARPFVIREPFRAFQNRRADLKRDPSSLHAHTGAYRRLARRDPDAALERRHARRRLPRARASFLGRAARLRTLSRWPFITPRAASRAADSFIRTHSKESTTNRAPMKNASAQEIDECPPSPHPAGDDRSFLRLRASKCSAPRRRYEIPACHARIHEVAVVAPG